MHPSSLRSMKKFRNKYLFNMKGCSVLDIGSMDMIKKKKKKKSIPGSYKQLFEKDFVYTGMDVESGPNVDIVGYDNIVNKYDVVISGQCMEHVKRPWDWLKNLTQYYKSYICIIAPNTWGEHRYPLDTYRYYPDGMRDLFEYAGIKEIEIFKAGREIFKGSGRDTVGIGGKYK